MRRIPRAAVAALALLVILGLTACGIIIPRDPYATRPATEGSSDTGERPGTETEPATEPNQSGIDVINEQHRYVSVDYEAIAAAYVRTVNTQTYGGKGVFITTPDEAVLTVSTDNAVPELSNALYRRNEAVQERLDISLFFQTAEPAAILQGMKDAENSDFFYTDLVLFAKEDTAAFVNSRSLMNLRTLMYVNFDASYYFPSSVTAASTDIYIWAVAGWASLNTENLPCLYFNRAMTEAAGAELPYDAVYDGLWTWDRYFRLAAAVSDGAASLSSSALTGTALTDAAFHSAGGEYARGRLNGLPYTVLASDDGLIVSLLQKAFRSEGPEDPDATFFNGAQTLYLAGTLADSARQSTSPARWGLLPLPKRSETQGSYRSAVGAGELLFAAARTTSDIALTGRVLGMLNAASYGVSAGTIADARLTGSFFRDSHSAAMYVTVAFSPFYSFTEVLGRMSSDVTDGFSSLILESLRGGNYAALYADRIEHLKEAVEAIS